MSRQKILDWQQAESRVDQWRREGRRVVQCHGVFDLLHIGHIRYFQKARQLGDILLVTITPDRFVNKGPNRPVFAERLRLEAVAALDCVDAVALNTCPTAREAILRLRPAIYAKGAEFRDNKTPELLLEESAAIQAGTEVAFIDELTSSSTLLINRHVSVLDDRAEEYLAKLRPKYSARDAQQFLDASALLRVLVVGETIIDEHYSCTSIGQSTKAPIVSTRYESHQRFAGGAVSVANHVAAFCGHVELVTMLGERDQEEEWLRGQLRDNIAWTALRKKDSPTIVKRRYRESYFDIPLFEVNSLNDTPLRPDQADWLTNELGDRARNVDAVIVADYGHAMIPSQAVEALCRDARYLAVTTPASSSNFGLHALSKYPRAEYFSLARRELELECRTPGADLEEMLRSVATRLGSRTCAVTLGRQGCLGWRQGEPACSAPALARRVVDRSGAGDVFFAVTALCALHSAPLEIVTFLGNLASAEAVGMLGNAGRESGNTLARSIATILK